MQTTENANKPHVAIPNASSPSRRARADRATASAGCSGTRETIADCPRSPDMWDAVERQRVRFEVDPTWRWSGQSAILKVSHLNGDRDGRRLHEFGAADR
jgi:hypothetical protein